VADNSEAWIKRGEQAIIAFREEKSDEIVPFAISMLSAIYGPQSPQLQSLRSRLERAGNANEGLSGKLFYQAPAATSAVENTIKEIQPGLISRL